MVCTPLNPFTAELPGQLKCFKLCPKMSIK